MQRDDRNLGVSPTTPGHLHFEAICFDKKIAIRGRHTVYGQPYVVAHVNRPGSARDGDDKKYACLFCASPDLLAAAVLAERILGEDLLREQMSGAGCYAELTTAVVQLQDAISRATGEVQS